MDGTAHGIKVAESVLDKVADIRGAVLQQMQGADWVKFKKRLSKNVSETVAVSFGQMHKK